jgi:hypothetical protein
MVSSREDRADRHGVGLELPRAKTVADVYVHALAAGLGDRDFSAVDAAG